MRKRVYISGPISKGDHDHNFDQAAAAHYKLLEAGFAPLNPILTIKLPWAFCVEHSVWMEADIPWVYVCDLVLRLPGESVGADEEVVYASKNGIPVFYDVDELIKETPCNS